MAFGDDITDPIPYQLSNPSGSTNFIATGEAYDIAISGLPFFVAPNDEKPYRRVTAQYRKQQIDQSREPGEQTLSGWWLRSQSSFHYGQGIKFYEPASTGYATSDESLRFQYTLSRGINPWTKGQATLLRDTNEGHVTTTVENANGRPGQFLRSIRWKSGTPLVQYEGALLHDGYDVDKIWDGGEDHFIEYVPGSEPVYAICDDGTYAYFVTNRSSGGGANRFHLFRKPLSGDHTTGTPGNTPTGDVQLLISKTGLVIDRAVIEFVKDRLVLVVNNSIYEILDLTTTSNLPAPLYTNPVVSYIYTSITESGSAIYVSGFNGTQSSVIKFTLNTSGAMPTLTSAITSVQMPTGEIIFKIHSYLGYMLFGTNKGIRAGVISDTDGSVQYGPLIVETIQPVFDFATRGSFVWAATGVEDNPGVIRLDLGSPLPQRELVFAYCFDLAWSPEDPELQVEGYDTVATAFLGNTDQLAFATTAVGVNNGHVYTEDISRLVPEGFLRTGYIRYNTLENKVYKLLQARIYTADGGIGIDSIDAQDDFYRIGSFAQGAAVPEININYPTTAQEYLGFAFTLIRSNQDSTKGPLFTGYQIKALPAVPRQELIQYPLFCFDHESDKFNNEVGYEGSAYDRFSQLKNIENLGDTIRVEDFRVNESYIGLIEEMDFINITPEDKRFSGWGGYLLVTIRTV
jgi:hypothetical protein